MINVKKIIKVLLRPLKYLLQKITKIAFAQQTLMIEQLLEKQNENIKLSNELRIALDSVNTNYARKVYYNNVPDFTHVMIELTNRCEYNCFCCPRELIKRKISTISLKDIRLIAYRLEKHLHKKINLSVDYFGEPLLAPDFIFKINEIRKYMPNFNITVTTTLGYLKEESFWNEYINLGIKETIVSLYGYDRESYKKIHGVDRFDIAYGNLERLIKLNDAKNGIMKINIAANNFQEDVMRNNFPEINIEKLFYQRDIFLEKILSHKNTTFYKRNLNNRGDGRKFNSPTNFKRCYCGSGKRFRLHQLAIDCEMNVTACCMDYDSSIKFGNLNENSLEEIFSSIKFKDFIKNMYLQDFTKYSICAGCAE